MAKGIGVDLVDIEELRATLASAGAGVTARLFTDAERAAAADAPDEAEFLATRFAAKEAVFKAVAHLTPTRTFDLRVVETLNDDDGAPYVNASPALGEVFKSAGVSEVLVSISTEKGFAMAFAIAQ